MAERRCRGRRSVCGEGLVGGEVTSQQREQGLTQPSSYGPQQDCSRLPLPARLASPCLQRGLDVRVYRARQHAGGLQHVERGGCQQQQALHEGGAGIKAVADRGQRPSAMHVR